MKLYLVTSSHYFGYSFHGVLTEEKYRKYKKFLKKKAVTVSEIDTEKQVDLRKLPNMR